MARFYGRARLPRSASPAKGTTVPNQQRLLPAVVALLVAGAVVLTSLGLATLRLVTADERYESVAKLYLHGDATDDAHAYADGTRLGEATLQGCVDLADSRTIAVAVVEEFELPVTPDALHARVRVDVVPETQVLEVTAGGSSPTDAQRVAQAWAEQAVALLSDTTAGCGTPEVVVLGAVTDPATLSTDPVSPSWGRTYLFAGLAGLGLGSLLGVAAAGVSVLLGRRGRQ